MGKEKAAAAPAVVAEVDELPKTIVRRVVKEKLSEVSGDGGDLNLHKEALNAFSESARIFIHYLSATAHDICTESKRQIINAEDVMNALEEIEFSEFVEPLRDTLDEFRKRAAGKRAGAAKAKEISKKQKTDEDTTREKGRDESEEINGDNSDEVEEQANGDMSDEVEEPASDDEAAEQASGDDEDEAAEQASGDDEEEPAEQASGDDEDDTEEQVNGGEEDEAEEEASGGSEDEAEEQASGDNEDEAEEQASGDQEGEVEEEASEEENDSSDS